MEVKDCFVIMPFSTTKSYTEEVWTEVFESFFKPAWIAFNVECYRTKVPRGSITKDIIEKLYSASVVLADLTDSNPNVMYELGVRHTFKKPSVMVKTKGSEIPFDVNDYNVFEYEYTPKGLEGLKEHINVVINDINKYPNKSDNPVWDFRNTSDFLIDYYRSMEALGKLEALKEEIGNNLEKCNLFLGQIAHIRVTKDFDDWMSNKPGKDEEKELDDRVEEFLTNMRNDSITHLRVTRYVSFTDEDWTILNKIDGFLRWCYLFLNNLASVSFHLPERERISEARDILRKGVHVISKRISELESK